MELINYLELCFIFDCIISAVFKMHKKDYEVLSEKIEGLLTKYTNEDKGITYDNFQR